jgi:hypothetical protein
MKYYDLTVTFLGKKFKVRWIEASSLYDAKQKVQNLVLVEELKESDQPKKTVHKVDSDNFISDFFNGFKK